MSLIVQKFGGTSVGDATRIKAVAKRVIETRAKGHDVVVVVSAMSGETNRLIDLAHQMTRQPAGREMDLLLATGEQVTIALVGLALQDLGQAARAYTGPQIKILTDTVHSKARIRSIDAERILNDVKAGHVVVIAGFQGVTADGDITTLGRGGSDTTAVAIAAAIKADLCEIYTDVDGVYTADPRIAPNARKLKTICHEEMLELASLGSKVLQIRSVELAANHHVNLVVRSSFNEEEGTLLTNEEASMEKIVVSGVTSDESEAKISLRDVPDFPGMCARVFGTIASANINVDMIIQNTGTDGKADLSFTIPRTDLGRCESMLIPLKDELGFGTYQIDEDIAKVSVVGLGMRSHVGVAAKMFDLLAKNGINIDMITTSEIKISVVVKKAHGRQAVQVLHDGFKLYKET